MAQRSSSTIAGAAASISVIALLVLPGCSGPANNPPTVGGEECLECMELGFSLDFEAEARDFRIDEGGPSGPPPICLFEREFINGEYHYTIGWCSVWRYDPPCELPKTITVGLYYTPPDPDQLLYQIQMTVCGHSEGP
ncbi:MAG: hypothetical protein PVH68_07030 [Armatimonadota bacterium]|jgi:hypothetical protein